MPMCPSVCGHFPVRRWLSPPTPPKYGTASDRFSLGEWRKKLTAYRFVATYHICLVLLLRGDLAKSLISAFLAELRFRAPPPRFFHPPDSELHACMRSGPTLVASMVRRFLYVSYIYVLPWYRRCVTNADRRILAREHRKQTWQKNATDAFCLSIVTEK